MKESASGSARKVGPRRLHPGVVTVFDLESFLGECQSAARDVEPRRAVREVLLRALEQPSDIAQVLGRDRGGIEILHHEQDLTVLNVIWAPRMTILPHDHRMWAAIGIYSGTEENVLYRRGPERIEATRGRELRKRDALVLGADAIHSVRNPERRFTGAIHVYGGDFVNMPRSQWDPDTLVEQPYDLEYVKALFERANAEWVSQLERELDEEVVLDGG